MNYRLYTKDKVIKILKVKNVFFMIIAILNLMVSVYDILSLIVSYHDDWETILNAESIPESIILFITGIILLIIAFISNRWIGDAIFYSSYFEGDLDGYITYSDLSEVTGKSEFTVKLQMYFFNIIYMKNYELKVINNIEQVVLNSKKYICECRNCGAPIEKRIYFTGICPYCRGSNLFAKVLTDNRFYSISNDMSGEAKKPNYYTLKNIKAKKALFWLCLFLGLFILGTEIIGCLKNIFNYNDEEYLTKVLLSGENHYTSFELIKNDMINAIVFVCMFIAVLALVLFLVYKKIKYLDVADICSQYFSKFKRPFIDFKSLQYIKCKLNKEKLMKTIKIAIRKRYLRNCTIEKHDGVLKVALAKKIIKDECPTCGSSIVGAVDENYICRYCGNMIMGVICKK